MPVRFERENLLDGALKPDGERGAEKSLLSSELWPTSQSRFEENFRGSLPPNTVAIVHTHPVRWPKPSIHDADEAARLAVPIYVVTRNAVFKVAPGREPEALVKGRRWVGATREPAASCERIERFSEGEAPIAR